MSEQTQNTFHDLCLTWGWNHSLPWSCRWGWTAAWRLCGDQLLQPGLVSPQTCEPQTWLCCLCGTPYNRWWELVFCHCPAAWAPALTLYRPARKNEEPQLHTTPVIILFINIIKYFSSSSGGQLSQFNLRLKCIIMHFNQKGKRREAEVYLCPCPNRQLCDLNGVFVYDWHLSTDQVLVLTQFMDHPFEVFVSGKLFGDKNYTRKNWVKE